MYHVQIRKKAKKELDRIPKERKKRILVSLLYLATDPFVGEALKVDFLGFYSLHVPPYRIIYQIYKQQLLVVRIRHRKDAYKK